MNIWNLWHDWRLDQKQMVFTRNLFSNWVHCVVNVSSLWQHWKMTWEMSNLHYDSNQLFRSFRGNHVLFTTVPKVTSETNSYYQEFIEQLSLLQSECAQSITTFRNTSDMNKFHHQFIQLFRLLRNDSS
jgi:hypothetical protein